MNRSTRILLAEDEEIVALIIADHLTSHGFEVVLCHDGLMAWEKLQAQGTSFDVILLDLMMPRLDGMELLRRIKREPSLVHIPVILETASGHDECIREGLAEGAYYYLTKPFQPEILVAIVQAAVEQVRGYRSLVEGLRRAERSIEFLQKGEFHFRDLEGARILANYLALACPEPERFIPGFQELLVNAVEHGNLEISYPEKGRLLLKGGWQEEIQRRLSLPEYQDRHVEVRFERHPETLSFTIQDQGKGFNWQDFMDFSPDRVFDLHGRGIAMSRKLSFDDLQYQGKGNIVVATVTTRRFSFLSGTRNS
jgi:CheY-like chemotaxis protein/anti-sigma regulatory factor (Ser/Thr protein kinase)